MLFPKFVPAETARCGNRHSYPGRVRCGSATGLGKATAHCSNLSQITIPTIPTGSGATPILGQTAEGVKTTLSDPQILPGVVIHDPEPVRTLPVAMAPKRFGLNLDRGGWVGRLRRDLLIRCSQVWMPRV